MESRHEAVDDLGAPDSWELADLDESMRRLRLNSKACASSQQQQEHAAEFTLEPPAASADSSDIGKDRECALQERINKVDQFLREAIQNPRERLSVLRMEQDVERFIQNPRQQQLEFPQLPTSYLRLAAHRIAQHYCMQSIVVNDNNSLDGSGTKIIVRKTNETRFPPIRLADIPVNLPQDEKNNVVKVAIKQRPQKGSQNNGGSGVYFSKLNNAKSVEERKEEYNKARARIFSSSSSPNLGNKTTDEESASFDNWQCCSMVALNTEEKHGLDDLRNNHAKAPADCSTGNGRINKSKGERESFGKIKANNRVAIFRDRETDRKDPDYDRSYDKYTQRFDPGFGFNMGPYSMQAMYAPAVNYNTEFPQLGAPHRAQMPVEPPPRPIPQHIRAPWLASTSTMGYGALDTMMGPFNTNHMGAPSASAMYMHSSPFACPSPAMTYVRPHERIQPSFSHPSLQQQQPEASFGQARPR
uniref:TSA: Wollemia nobilis Ref_Wollemi_Transcript_21836_2134 transcribed RNA sequence n=1 Tax=Wollemia nobilis TaxID=56998 RepID=A0A0C9RHJ3_9CONI